MQIDSAHALAWRMGRQFLSRVSSGDVDDVVEGWLADLRDDVTAVDGAAALFLAEHPTNSRRRTPPGPHASSQVTTSGCSGPVPPTVRSLHPSYALP
ncbi:MAG: hypothetical protein ACQERF_09680 [Actinomycetota bacterium]